MQKKRSRLLLFFMLVLFSTASFAQQRTVTGVVQDATTGQVLSSAVISVGQSGQKVTADKMGKFKVQLNPGDSVLHVSFVGYLPSLVNVEGKDILIVRLEAAAQNLNDVVVIGYGTVKKRDLTGAVTSIKSEDLSLTPTANAMDAVQGKAPGVDIQKASGRAGAGVNVVVRGNRSIYGDNTPLYIIDGIPGDYAKLNPSDIESIDILKDASSTAIYGSAGANGVVIITTKKGKNGNTVVDANAYVGYNGFPRYPHGLRGEDYLKLKREAYRGEKGDYPEFDNDIFSDPALLAAYQDNQWVDWVDLALRDGIEQNYSASVRGGTDKVNTYFSLNYNNEQGLIT